MSLARAAIALPLVLGAAGIATAQPAVPFATTPPAVRADEARIVAAHRASIDHGPGSYATRRRSARDRAKERACAAIHGYVDELVARASVSPADLEALHRAIDAHCAIIGVRPTVDGGAVVQVAVAFDALRAAADPEGAPW